MKVKVNIINAFSIGETGGNSAGVVFNADNFTKEIKQSIATKAGFPETAFVSSSKIADFKLDFFTPTKQIAHCGHATIATFSYLKKKGKITGDQSSKETIDGIRKIKFDHGLAFMEQNAPVMQVPVESMEEILSSLHIGEHDIKPGQSPTIVNTGNSFLMVPIKNEAILSGIDYDRKIVYRVSERYGLIGYYVYVSPGNTGFDASARMFGPFYGIEEESGTGMAAGPLAAYLYEVEKINKEQFLIEQGRFMKTPSPSLIRVNLELRGGTISRLFAGGDAYISGEKIVEIN
jgi:PhzF family phenazine biosynthesis protein